MRSTSTVAFWWCLQLAFLLSVNIMIVYANNDDAAQSVGKLRSQAEVHFSKGEIDQSLQLWSKVISLEPTNDTNFYKRFRVYLRQQKLKEALADLTAVLSLNPKHENALVQRAKLNMRLGKCIDAEGDYDKLKK